MSEREFRLFAEDRTTCREVHENFDHLGRGNGERAFGRRLHQVGRHGGGANQINHARHKAKLPKDFMVIFIAVVFGRRL